MERSTHSIASSVQFVGDGSEAGDYNENDTPFVMPLTERVSRLEAESRTSKAVLLARIDQLEAVYGERPAGDSSRQSDTDFKVSMLERINRLEAESRISKAAQLERVDRLQAENRELRGEIARLSRKGILRATVYIATLEQGEVVQLSSCEIDGLEWTGDVQKTGDELRTTLKVLGVAEGTTQRGSFDLKIISNGQRNPLIERLNQPLVITSTQHSLSRSRSQCIKSYSVPLAKFKDACEKFIREEQNGAWVADFELSIHVLGAIIYGADEDPGRIQQVLGQHDDRLVSLESANDAATWQISSLKNAIDMDDCRIASLSTELASISRGNNELCTQVRALEDRNKVVMEISPSSADFASGLRSEMAEWRGLKMGLQAKRSYISAVNALCSQILFVCDASISVTGEFTATWEKAGSLEQKKVPFAKLLSGMVLFSFGDANSVEYLPTRDSRVDYRVEFEIHSIGHEAQEPSGDGVATLSVASNSPRTPDPNNAGCFVYASEEVLHQGIRWQLECYRGANTLVGTVTLVKKSLIYEPTYIGYVARSHTVEKKIERADIYDRLNLGDCHLYPDYRGVFTLALKVHF